VASPVAAAKTLPLSPLPLVASCCQLLPVVAALALWTLCQTVRTNQLSD
jgi:hypothetical protein